MQSKPAKQSKPKPPIKYLYRMTNDKDPKDVRISEVRILVTGAPFESDQTPMLFAWFELVKHSITRELTRPEKTHAQAG